jgi:sulfate permease, SulP family
MNDNAKRSISTNRHSFPYDPSTSLSWRRWKPRLLDVLPSYDRSDFGHDVVAGLTVGLVALPLAMAFGIASGTTPQAGIYTAIVGGFVVSLLGGSRIQIGGPTGAFVVVVAAIIAEHGTSGLYMVTMMAGVILLVMAFTGLGTAVRFIPRPIVIGFERHCRPDRLNANPRFSRPRHRGRAE